MRRFGPSRKPDSALSRHPSPGRIVSGPSRAPPWRSRAYQPGTLERTSWDPGTIWLARTGGLPGRPLAGYRRWALTPPFHPSPVLGRSAPRGAPTEPSAGLLSVALDVTGGLRHPASL